MISGPNGPKQISQGQRPGFVGSLHKPGRWKGGTKSQAGPGGGSWPPLEKTGRCTTRPSQGVGFLSSALSRAVFLIFVGMQAVTFDSANGDRLDSIQRPWFPAVKYLFTFGDRIRLRVDLGQSQPGNSSLSPGACRVENTTAELAVSEILPITSVRAPRYFVGRSLKGAKET